MTSAWSWVSNWTTFRKFTSFVRRLPLGSRVQVIRAVFEQGIELRFVSDRWTISSAPPAAGAAFASLSDAVTALSPLRPLLFTEKRSFGGDLTLLLRCGGKEYFGICVSDLINRSLSTDTLYPVYHLAYLLGALSYHCQRLAELYAQIAVRYCEITQIPGHSDSNDVATFGYQTEPYYEFEALVGAARRSYDSIRYVLWQRFGPRKGSTPRSLETLLKARSDIPETLHKRLTTSWQNFGVPLTHYRDCIHHYVPVDFGLAYAFMRRHPLRAWTTTIRIPDNPEIRSKNGFTFALGRDALTYAWELADEVLGVVIAAVEAAVPRQANA